MDHVSTLCFGEEEERSLDNARKLSAAILPDGVVFICGACNRSEVAHTETIAKAMIGNWPQCHGAKMDLRPIGDTPRRKKSYLILFESQPDAVSEDARLKRLLKVAGRYLGFRCLRVEEVNNG